MIAGMTDAEIADRIAIADLINRYCDAINRGDWDAHQACFAPDAVWEVGPPANLRLETAAGIRQGTQAALSSIEFIIQKICSAVVELESASTASARVLLEEVGRGPDRQMFQYGLYRDRLVKVDGTWLFQSRRFEFIYATTPVLDGALVTPRSELAKR